MCVHIVIVSQPEMVFVRSDLLQPSFSLNEHEAQVQKKLLCSKS